MIDRYPVSQDVTLFPRLDGQALSTSKKTLSVDFPYGNSKRKGDYMLDSQQRGPSSTYASFEEWKMLCFIAGSPLHLIRQPLTLQEAMKPSLL